MTYKRIYFLGIGGIGMSALARYFYREGVDIHGYDRTATALTKELEEEGMHIHYEDRPDLVPEDIDMVIYTPAIPKTLGEWEVVRSQNVPIKKRAEVLGILSQGKRCVAIAGTHGKTTTSAMTTHFLNTASLQPSAFLGGIAENFHSNFVHGQSDIVVVEADEYDRSFLQLYPEIAIITAIDADHLDIYGTYEEVIKAFLAFAGQINKGGQLFIYQPYRHLLPDVIEGISILTYGEADADVVVRLQSVGKDSVWTFDYQYGERHIEGIRLPMPGLHNMLNATAAISAALSLGASDDQIRSGVSTFKGIKRRFEYVLTTEAHVLIDDYGHHPGELNSAIRTARKIYPDRKITGVFQPHLFSRTRDFAEGFAAALDELDEVVLLPIYPAREQPIPGVTSASIMELMKNRNCTIVAYDELVDFIDTNTTEVLVVMGAGDIDKLLLPLKNKLLA